MISDKDRLTDKDALTVAKTTCWILLAALLFMVYHYNKQSNLVADFEAEKLQGDTTYQKTINMFCSKMNDTLDDYYLVNKNDLELQATIHIDTTSLDTITLKK